MRGAWVIACQHPRCIVFVPAVIPRNYGQYSRIQCSSYRLGYARWVGSEAPHLSTPDELLERVRRPHPAKSAYPRELPGNLL